MTLNLNFVAFIHIQISKMIEKSPAYSIMCIAFEYKLASYEIICFFYE
jgi:hypothetical protein